MDQATHNRIVSFIWGIADDVLRDLFKRGKYPDVILPMCVLLRMDAVLEPTKQAVLDTKQMLDDVRITEQRAALADAAGQAFDNTSRFTLRDLKSRGSHQQLLADFEDYKIKSGTYLLFDDACGTGGMLTVAEETLSAIGKKRGLQVEARLYGQEINPETYAICKADMLIKGEGLGGNDSADHIVGGAEWSTLSHDAFPGQEFDFMVANPPYGKSWKKDLEALGSRIAEVHNGSSLFTGDAGQGESNIRRWLIENDWPGVIVALPLNLFYNTGIATYVWLLSNRKPAHRKGRVQLIDASQWFKPLRKNLGKKNCELAPDDIERISRTFLDFKETPESKIFSNAAFGYWKVTVERPLRLHSQLSLKATRTLRFASGDEEMRAALHDEFGDELFGSFDQVAAALEKRLAEWGSDDEESQGDDAEDGAGARKGLPEKRRKKLLAPKTWERDGRLVEVATALREALGDALFEDHNVFRDRVDAVLKKAGTKLPAAELKLILKAVGWRVETAPPVIAKVHKPGKLTADPMLGRYDAMIAGKPSVVEYEPDADLRDTEQVPLLEEGGIEAFIRREVLPYTPDAWINNDATKIGYEVSFTRHFYKPQPLRTLAEISADILAIEKEAEGLLDGLLVTKAEA